ncbi:MAG: sodium:solute symporter family transporter [Bacteriovoracaceae bacterium]
MSFFVHKKLRKITESENLLSFGGVLSRWQHGSDFRKLRLLVGIITVVFLGVYAAAQFRAGSKALHVLFGWDYSTGAIIGSVIVFLYCLSGGIRASIWTDAAQSIVMIFAMSMLFFVGVSEVGGFDQYIAKLNAVSPGFLDVTPTGLAIDNSIGVVLAGIFSATMSTADSQILSCSAAFTRDILPKEKDTLLITKVTTGLVTVVALLIALFGSKNVFELVLIAWSVLSAAFGPLMLVYALGKKVSETTAILMVVNGVGVTLFWREFGLGGTMYEVAPGMMVGFITYFVLSKTKWNSSTAK